jgi:hypothetical protein
VEKEMKMYLPQTWTDPRIEFKKSPISGDGMFAREPIKKGEVVCIVGGMVMTDSEFALSPVRLLYPDRQNRICGRP